MITIKSNKRNINGNDLQLLSNDQMGSLVGGEDVITNTSSSTGTSGTGDGTTGVDPLILIKK